MPRVRGLTAFALAATACTEHVTRLDKPVLLFCLYWGVFARLVLVAVKRGMLVSVETDLSKPREKRLPPLERHVLEVVLLNMIRIEFLISVVLLALSLTADL